MDRTRRPDRAGDSRRRATLRAATARAKMAVNQRGGLSGALSGGCVEGAVVEVVEQVLRGGPPRLLHSGIADSQAWDVGLPCGGEIDVLVQAYEPGRFADLARMAAPVACRDRRKGGRLATARGRIHEVPA